MNFNINNPILNTDSYKPSHWLQYPPNTEYVFAYGAPRGGEHEKVVFFGLQMLDVLTRQVTIEDVDEANLFFNLHGEPFNREGWIRLIEKHNGYFPISIRAVPEGTVVPNKNVLYTVENTDPEFYWLTSYLETAILRSVWYGTTVATVSWNIKQIIRKFLIETGDVNLLPFKLHDFGARGVSSFESAGIGGAAHLVNFMGSDTITGILYAMKYYNTKDMVGFSIPAGEHSSYTSWGKLREVEAYRNMLTHFGGKGKLFAAVSDSYDIFNAVENIWGEELRQEVIDSGSIVVIRPDSGDPASVVTRIAQIIDSKYGSTINDKGYKVLNNLRIIQGDGINEQSIVEILTSLKNNGYSTDNVAFGMGGALLQKVDRDTDKFAMKTSAIQIDGVWSDVFKDPVTDPGKSSLKGKVTLFKDAQGNYFTDRIENGNGAQDCLVEVYRNGKFIKKYTFEEVRNNSCV